MGDNDSTKSYLNPLKFEHLDKHISDRFLKCVVKYRSHTCNLTIGDVSHKNPTLIFPFLKINESSEGKFKVGNFQSRLK